MALPTNLAVIRDEMECVLVDIDEEARTSEALEAAQLLAIEVERLVIFQWQGKLVKVSAASDVNALHEQLMDRFSSQTIIE